RWRELGLEAEKRSLTLTKLCTTRWSSRIDAVRAVRDRYPHIMRVLTRLSLTSTNKAEREDAKQLKNKIDKLEFVIFIVMWERVLRAINSASKELQSQKIDLSVASRLLNCALCIVGTRDLKKFLELSSFNCDSPGLEFICNV
ncbi:Hypothetical predicted protein, partial [Paramuricea clavata]